MTSDSPSGVSNGVRLVSATAAVKKRIAPSGCLTMPHSHGNGPCAATIAPGSSVPYTRNAPRMARPIVTSYDIICDEARRPPSSDHLLYDDQPASVVPYTASDAKAK